MQLTFGIITQQRLIFTKKCTQDNFIPLFIDFKFSSLRRYAFVLGGHLACPGCTLFPPFFYFWDVLHLSI